MCPTSGPPPRAPWSRWLRKGFLAFDDGPQPRPPALPSRGSRSTTSPYVYTIREGATFHDGTPVTAADVVASWSWNLNPDNFSFVDFFFFSVDTIEATGDREVHRDAVPSPT